MPAMLRFRVFALYRHYMRRTRVEIIHRIIDMFDEIPVQAVIDQTRIVLEVKPTLPAPKILHHIAVNHKEDDSQGIADCITAFPKKHLVSALILAHNMINDLRKPS